MHNDCWSNWVLFQQGVNGFWFFVMSSGGRPANSGQRSAAFENCRWLTRIVSTQKEEHYIKVHSNPVLVPFNPLLTVRFHSHRRIRVPDNIGYSTTSGLENIVISDPLGILVLFYLVYWTLLRISWGKSVGIFFFPFV